MTAREDNGWAGATEVDTWGRGGGSLPPSEKYA